MSHMTIMKRPPAPPSPPLKLLGTTALPSNAMANAPLVVRHEIAARALRAAELANASQREGSDRRVRHRAGLPPRVGQITLAEAASRYRVGRAAVSRARLVLRQGAPEVIAALRSGLLSMFAAVQIATRTESFPEQVMILNRMLTVGTVRQDRGQRTRLAPVSYVMEGDSRLDKPQPRDAVKQFALAIDKLDIGSEIVQNYAGAAAQDERRLIFARELFRVRRRLSRAIRLLRATPDGDDDVVVLGTPVAAPSDHPTHDNSEESNPV